jgi:hypothetical protein
MPEDIIFNQDLALDLMWLDGQALYAFLEAWATLYLVYPDTFKLDQGSVLTSPRWKELSDMAGIRLQLSEIESHSSIGSGEIYHATLRRIYTKIRMDYPELDLNLVLWLYYY